MSERPKGDSSRMPGPGSGPPAMRMAEKPKDFKKSLRQMTAYLTPFKWQMVIVTVFAAASTIFMIVSPKILVRATDELAAGMLRAIGGADSDIDFGYIGGIILLLVVLYCISALFSYVQGFIMSGITTKVSYNLRNEVMQKINRLPLVYFNATPHGDILSRITNDIDTLSQAMNQSLTQLITSVTQLIGVLIMMLTISWQMTLVALGIIPVTLILVAVVVRASQKHFKGNQAFLGAVNGQVEEMYGGHLIVRAYNGEQQAINRFEEDNDRLFHSSWKSQFLSGMMHPIMNFVGNIGYVVICVVGASLAVSGNLTIGGIQAFISYVRSFTQPIMQLANISNQMQSAMAASERVFDFLGKQEERNPPPKHRTDEFDIKGGIRFEHVRFGYEDSDEIVIRDFTTDIRPGQTVAIVGFTGAGKTTLVKLLMRFHELKGGAILLDGRNIAEFDRHELRREFGMVLQDTWLYSDTIMENIRYGRLTATDEEVIAAAKAAQVDHFVRTLPDGYDMVLNEEGTNISQGQKQLITIARALLSDSRIMILDEATSSVDTRTEMQIQQAMKALTKGRTSFVIAHRLSTIRDADLILVVHDGDIAEQGTHKELLAANGFYANLYNSQFSAGAGE